jgi:hypothetical protein
VALRCSGFSKFALRSSSQGVGCDALAERATLLDDGGQTLNLASATFLGFVPCTANTFTDPQSWIKLSQACRFTLKYLLFFEWKKVQYLKKYMQYMPIQAFT